MTAPNQYYVDPAINANSGTGTIGDPFGDLQYAFNTITRSTTVGDQINVKAGTAETRTTSFTLATYGSPTCLIIRGYTSAANDGGIGEITFNANNANLFASAPANTQFIDMKVGNNVGGDFNLGSQGLFLGCELHTSSGAISSSVMFSKILEVGVTNQFTISASAGFVIGNFIKHSKACRAIQASGQGAIICENVISLNNTSSNAVGIYQQISAAMSPGVIKNNTIYNAAAGTGCGIDMDSRVTNQSLIINNIIEGFSGTGGTAIKINASNTRNAGVIRANRWFNCANGYAGTDAHTATDNSALASSPFASPSTDDFRVSSAVAGIGWPPAYYGSSVLLQYLDLGALQRQATGGGSRMVNIRGGADQ